MRIERGAQTPRRPDARLDCFFAKTSTRRSVVMMHMRIHVMKRIIINNFTMDYYATTCYNARMQSLRRGEEKFGFGDAKVHAESVTQGDGNDDAGARFER